MNPQIVPMVRTQIRSDKFLKRWQYDSPANNPYQSQYAKKSSDPVEQQIRPFVGQTQDGLLYRNDDQYMRRMVHGMPASSPHQKLELILRYETALRLQGPDSKLVKLLEAQLDAYDNLHPTTPTIHR